MKALLYLPRKPRRLSESAVCELFFKNRGCTPFYTELHLITNGVFLPKSALNEIRRGIYAKAFSYFNKADKVDFCKYTLFYQT